MTEINFKEIWQSQEAKPIANADEIAAKAKGVKRSAMLKIVLGNLLLLLTMAFIIWVVVYFEPKMISTKIGALVIVAGLMMQIIASSKLIPLLRKNDAAQNHSDYLQQLLLLKKKQAFLETTIMSLYFILLGIGLGLYMVEYALMLSVANRWLYCGLTFLWMAFAWFYLRPRTIKKQRQKLDDAIAQLERLEKQLNEKE
ncbi:MAG TPA: hypothetical protein PLS51_02010 [Flavobacterium sp.]|jgi:hypothetical protein|nr:hypothetical protein [Flavobacterium sp.]HPJ09377.1 hypothetical protein [Flavobacterium sp.]